MQITSFIESIGQRTQFHRSREQRVLRPGLTHFDPVCPFEVPEIIEFTNPPGISSSGGCRFESYMAHQQNQGVSRDRLAPLFRPGAHRLILQHPGVGGQFQSTYLSTGRGSLQFIPRCVIPSGPVSFLRGALPAFAGSILRSQMM